MTVIVLSRSRIFSPWYNQIFYVHKIICPSCQGMIISIYVIDFRFIRCLLCKGMNINHTYNTYIYIIHSITYIYMSKLSQTFSKQKPRPSLRNGHRAPAHGPRKALVHADYRLDGRETLMCLTSEAGDEMGDGEDGTLIFFWRGLEKWSTGKRVFGKGCRNCCDHHEYHHQWMTWWCVGCHCDGGGRGFKKEQQKWSEKSKPNCKNPAETSPPKFRCFSL